MVVAMPMDQVNSQMDQIQLISKSNDVPDGEEQVVPGFCPERLTLARRRRGLTKIELATDCGLDTRSIWGFEAAEFAPSDETLRLISKVLRYPTDFFRGEPLAEPRPDTASFRAQSKMSASQRDMALSQGALALHLNAWLDERFELPSVCVPELSREKTPESAADALRREWGLGNAPIRNMVHLLESKGIRVFALSVKAREVDAFSMWHGETPFVFLNTQKTAEHSRFDAAHELGHIVLDKHAACQGRESERRADAFASAFLMPRSSILANPARFKTIDELVSLKKRWIVSVAALAYRYHTLHVLSDWQYRSIYINLAKRGYSKSEPMPAPHETSQLLHKAFDQLRSEGILRSHVAKELRLPISELEDLLLGLTFGRLDGGRTDREGAQKGQAELFVVK
jgi:Zn-dependent peptidase ImmA (M78 family)